MEARHKPFIISLLIIIFIILTVRMSTLWLMVTVLSFLAYAIALTAKSPSSKAKPTNVMSLRHFLFLLGIVGLIAAAFSPSHISPPGLGETGTSSPLDASISGTSGFVDILRASGYRVVIANNTVQLEGFLRNERGPRVLVLVGPDEDVKEQGDIMVKGYHDGTLSLLIAEGNRTNNQLLLKAFNARVTGAAISQDDNPHTRKTVFDTVLTLDGQQILVTLDVASPIMFVGPGLSPIAMSSQASYDTMDAVYGPRTVIASGESGKARALLISDSAPFTNFDLKVYDGRETQRMFVLKAASWVARSVKGTTFIIDNSHYTTKGGPPVGKAVSTFLETVISNTDQAYTGFSGNIGPYERLGYALLLGSAVYAALARYYAYERDGKDDEPVPLLEKSTILDSMQKRRFLGEWRDKEFYLNNLSRLYDVLDLVSDRELGTPLAQLTMERLRTRFTEAEARRMAGLLHRLAKVHAYNNREKKRLLMFPPVYSWKGFTVNCLREAELFLNRLGLALLANEERPDRMVEYRFRR